MGENRMNTPKNIAILFRKMDTNITSLLTPVNLSSAKVMFLFCIYDHKQMTQVEICRALDLDKSTVAKMLVRLEKDNFITKKVNPKDVRSHIITLTEKALALIPKAKEQQDKWLDQVTSGLTALEKKNFYELLEKVANAVNEKY